MRAWEGLKVCQNVVRVSPGCAMGLELGLGTFAQKALCTVPSSPGKHFPDPKIWQKRTEWYTAGWESRSLGWVTGVDARATGTRRLHGRSREYSFSCTPGWRPVVSRAAFLHGRLQLSSGTTAMLDTLSLNTAVCIAQSVYSSSHQQRSSAVYNGCREAGTTARASGGLRASRIAPLFYKPWFIYGVQFAPRIQTMVL
jgi:hypothetical protein